MTNTANSLSAPSLLLPSEPPAFEIINAVGNGSAVLVCDHASNRVPSQLKSLGLDSRQLDDHIGWDPGAAEVARQLSVHLDAPLVRSGYSRLVIDCNRPPSSEESIAQVSAGVQIPGNHKLSAEQQTLRLNSLFQPYHQAIARLLDKRAQRPTALLSIHSFSPVLDGKQRPWHIGISNRQDRRLADLMIRALSEPGDLLVGDNEPYPIEDHMDYTLPEHGESRALPHIMIEIRQDMIATDSGATSWGSRLAEAYLLIEAEVQFFIEP